MKTLLITGANGFLGSRLASRYKNKYNVLTPSRSEMDICDKNNVSDFFDDKKPDITIHCAAISNTRFCEENEELAHIVNVEGAVAVAESCKRHNSKMILCSSDQIYNGNRSLSPHRENDAVCPQTVYAKQKLEAENICLDVCTDIVCLRLSWMYDNKTVSTNEHSDLFRTVVAAVKNMSDLSYPIYDFRGITYVDFVVDCIEKAFVLQSGVYNFGSENNMMMNTYEIVRVLLSELNASEKILSCDEKSFAYAPRNLCMNLDKINKQGIYIPSTLNGLKICCSEYMYLNVNST